MGNYDPGDVLTSLQLLHVPGSVVEVRALETKEGTISGYFNDFQKLTAAVERYDGRETLYMTMNAVKPDLLARASNRLKTRARSTTSDTDITRRHWILIDLDAKRASGISSSESEHNAAKEKVSEIRAFLMQHKWPDPVIADSGNGWHLLYPIDEPNNTYTTNAIQQFLVAIDSHFSDEYVDVDLKCFNAGRITKLYGTLACKGDNLEERPHRRSRIVHTPKSRTLVTMSQIEVIAALSPKPEVVTRSSAGKYGAYQEDFELGRWISNHGISVKREISWKGTGRKWILETCPWNSEHNRGEAFIVEQPGGAIGAGCRHNSCSQYGWRDLRLMYEPDAYDRPQPVINESIVPAPLRALIPSSRVQVIRELHQVDPSSPADDWDEPLTLTDDVMPPFPLGSLPSAIRDHVEEVADAVQTPIGMQAMSALAVLASINSRRCKVQVGSASRRHIETLNLYIAIASDPGTRKSTALRTVTFPLDNLEMELTMDLGPEYAAKRDIYDSEVKRLEWLKAAAAKCADAGEAVDKHQQIADLRLTLDKGVPPSVPKLIVQDITTESLSETLAEQEDNCIALFAAEGGIFSIIKGQYAAKGKASDAPSMDIWLKAWNGEYHKVSRKAAGSSIVHAPMLTIGVMVQPGVLRSLLQSEVMRDNGFLDRFLYCMPENLMGTRLYKDDNAVNHAEYAYNRTIRRLFDMPTSATLDNRGKRFIMTLSPDAVAVYAHCYNDIERRQAPDKDLAGMAGWASKFPGNVIRIAGNLHMVKCMDCGRPWDEPISAETMAEAWTIGHYLIHHAREAFGEMRADPCTALAKRILKWSQRRNENTFTFRDCYQAHHTTDSKEEIEAALLKLIDHSYMRLEENRKVMTAKGGRPPKPLFVLHPQVIRG